MSDFAPIEGPEDISITAIDSSRLIAMSVDYVNGLTERELEMYMVHFVSILNTMAHTLEDPPLRAILALQLWDHGCRFEARDIKKR